MTASQTETVKFNFNAAEMIDGRWQDVVHTGTARVVERGFQMQLGRDGYHLQVVDSPFYAQGTSIRVFPHSVR